MKFTSFSAGFGYELANRVFARRSMALLAERTKQLDSAPFWQAYHRLEEFNAPRFAAAAERMKIAPSNLRVAQIRGWATGRTPHALLTELLRFAYPRTVEYAQDLRRLAADGPETERQFLDYMVRQEDLQVRMMHAALQKNYAQITTMVEEFIAAEMP